MIFFNQLKNVNFNQIKSNIIRMSQITSFINKVVKVDSFTEVKECSHSNSSSNKDIKELSKDVNISKNDKSKLFDNDKIKQKKMEQCVYIFRLFLKGFVLMLLNSKLTLKFSKVKMMLEIIESMLNDFKKLDKFFDKIDYYSEKFSFLSTKFFNYLTELNSVTQYDHDNNTHYFILLLNYTCLCYLRELLLNSLEINSDILLKKYKLFIPNGTMYPVKSSLPKDNKFFTAMLTAINNFAVNFEINIDNYVEDNLTINNKYEIFEELKNIYLKNLVYYYNNIY
jgi:hypothetical protein